MARPLKLSFLSNKGDAYNWKFCRIGGVTRVKIESGEDIRHLPELDRKMWTVLNCPVQGLEMDAKTLQILDTDHDGRINIFQEQFRDTVSSKIIDVYFFHNSCVLLLLSEK